QKPGERRGEAKFHEKSTCQPEFLGKLYQAMSRPINRAMDNWQNFRFCRSIPNHERVRCAMRPCRLQHLV
ncbi:hypothetical protein, partial [Mesorhizobium sp.]|uniref:hypothetical protein n=1 Tax=Mesorhizobium sp. TaxID=1871066 RepID=UPI0025CE47E3